MGLPPKWVRKDGHLVKAIEPAGWAVVDAGDGNYARLPRTQRGDPVATAF